MSVISTICPSIDTNLQHKDIKLTSPSAVSIRQWISTSYSNSQASFSAPPPSTSVFIDRAFYVSTPVTITYAGSTSGSNLLQGGFDCLRSYPIASITNSCQLTINNQTFTIQTKDIVPYLAHYWKQSKFSSYPSMLDNYQTYSDGTGAINNPLGQYFNATDHHQPRGGYPMIIVNGSTSASISATIYEPLWIPQILHKEFDMGLGLSNIRTCDVVINYSSNLARIVSHATSSATFSNVSVSIGQPVLYMIYSTPPIGYVPRNLVYGGEDINQFVTQTSTPLTSNSSVTIASSNIQLNCIPKWIEIYVREANANLTYASTDTACAITGLSIQFNNISGILSTASAHDLYSISKNNGLQETWEQFSGITSNLTNKIGTTGSFVKLFFGKDITLSSGEFVGKVGAYNLQMSVTCTNVNQSASIVSPSLYILTSVPQKVIIHEGGQIESIIGVSGEEGEYMPYHAVMKHYGGSFGSWIKNAFNKAVNWLKDNHIISGIAKLIPHPIAQALVQPISSMGFGGRRRGGMEIGGDEDEGEGGRMMSRNELMRRVRSYK